MNAVLWVGIFLVAFGIVVAWIWAIGVELEDRAEQWGEELKEYDGGPVIDPYFYDQELEGARKVAPNTIVRKQT